MTEDHEYFKNKRNDRVYLSRSLEKKELYLKEGEIKETTKPFRIVSKVIDTKESHEFVKNGKEVALHISSGQRQEIKASFYEDSRKIFALQIQKFTVKTGSPHKVYFSFYGDEISILYNFLRNIAILPLSSDSKAKLDDHFIEELVLTRDQAINLISEQPDLVEELIRHQTTTQEIALLGKRKEQLAVFGKLLNDQEYFEICRYELGKNKRPEDVWQNFFEKNTWIFGYGLCYQFNSPLEGKKLEQVVKGYDFQSPGKRIDGLLKTQGFLSSLAFGEIKTHTTPLIAETKQPYRSGAWRVSNELTGGIAQVQRTVQISLENIRTKTEVHQSNGIPTGEQVFMYTPRSFLVVGSLMEFHHENGINEQKYSSFEMFRRNLNNPEIITFDELYQRALYIVESNEGTELNA